ncbi:MAG TPA: glycosyltransferase family 4 protein [Alphaproteobacteria bacterium]|nr:glycosyltransferase family 4 protein [Alphaproteobacteria bacterium]
MDILYIGFDIEGVGTFANYCRHQIRALQKLGHATFVVSLETENEDRRVVPRLADLRMPCLGNDRSARAMVRFFAAHRGRFDLAILNHVDLAGYGLGYKVISGSPYAINAYSEAGLRKLSLPKEFALSRAGLIIANCRRTVDRLPEFHRRMPAVGLLPDPFDVATFRPIAKDAARAHIEQRYGSGPLADRFVITTVASLSLPPSKGHRQTIDALAVLRHRRYLYLVGGDGPDNDAIATYAAERGVTGQVCMLGLIDQDDLPKLYSASDIAVSLGSDVLELNESAPLGLVEAAACGVPFVCASQGGAVEMISRARPYGIAIDPAKPDQLAVILQQLADSPGALKAMGENGRSVVEATFSFDKFSYTLAQMMARRLGVAHARATGASLATSR